jgi:hypothetical protein
LNKKKSFKILESIFEALESIFEALVSIFEALESDFEVEFTFSGWVWPAMKKKQCSAPDFNSLIFDIFI